MIIKPRKPKIVPLGIAIATKNRPHHFIRCIKNLNSLMSSKLIDIVILDGNDNNSATNFLNTNTWNFNSYRIMIEKDCIKSNLRGQWPIMYNYMFSSMNNKYLSYWSDDIICKKDPFGSSIKLANSSNAVGIAFAFKHKTSTKLSFQKCIDTKTTLINFGIFLRSAGLQIGFLSEEFKFYHADQDFSMKLAKIGPIIENHDTNIFHNNSIPHKLAKTKSEEYLKLTQIWSK